MNSFNFYNFSFKDKKSVNSKKDDNEYCVYLYSNSKLTDRQHDGLKDFRNFLKSKNDSNDSKPKDCFMSGVDMMKSIQCSY